ncbi:MAG TPA: polymer-forming cytoskeletal protein [Burkholderiaceae bacterium]
MFNRKKQPPIKSLIAADSTIQGHISFGEGLRIDGKVYGNVLAIEGRPSILVISESAVVTGEIHADHVIINGKVTGQVNASELLELQPTARIEGDVNYRALEMHQGATIAGKLRPIGELEEKPALTLAANNG